MALDPNINRIKFHRTKVAGREPTTANVSEGELALNLTDKTIYTNDGTKIVRIGDPDKLPRYEVLGTNSAILRNAAGLYAQSGTGALVISLPKAKFNSTTMLKIRVDGYNYSQDGAWSLELGGYNYTNSVWWNTFANLTSGGATTPFIRGLSNVDASASVKFGASTDRNIIVIGSATTTWQYPNIQISEVLLGSSNSTNGGWDSDWTIGFVNNQTVLDSYTYLTGQGQPKLYGINRSMNADTLFTPRLINGVSFDGSENITVYDATKLPLTGGTITGTLQVNGSFTANTNIQNTTGNNLSFLNGGSTLGINVGNILVSNSYSDVTKVPANGAYLKGGLDADNVIRAAIPTSYTTLTAVGLGVYVPFKAKDANIGSTYGFSPILGWNTQSSQGFRQVNHIGTYRPSANWAGSGVYIATGRSDAAATEAFLFQSGRTISNTAGPVLVKGISDYANNIDATPGSLYGNAAIGWRKLGIANIPQNGRALMLSIFGGTGFNSPYNPQQAMPLTIVLKSGNNNPKNLNMVVHAHDTQNLLANLGAGVANACYVPIGTGDDYEVWIYSVGFLSANLVAHTGVSTSWAQDFTPAPVTDKPTGAIDARIFTIANTKSNVASADKLSTPRTINKVAFDGTSNISIQQQSIRIPSGSDLNTYLNEGFYHCPLNSDANTITNSPALGAFSLLVEVTAGVKQTWTQYSPDSSRTFIRNIYANTVGAWREVAYTDAPTFTGTGRFVGNLTVNGITNTTGLNNSGALRSSGSSYLGNQMELGTVGTVSPVYIDFHSGASDIDYDSRIISTGGTTAVGNGALSYIAASHTFNGSIGAGIISASSISVSTGLGIANSSNTVLAGLSLYGGAQSGKPNCGITFTGTSNAGTGRHGDLTNATWATYLTCATSGAEKRGWIFQRSDNNTNVASISTDGVLSTNGSIQTLSDDTMINVGNNSDLALVKKAGGAGFVGVGSNAGFAVKRSNLTTVDPSNTFTDLFTVSSAGVANAVGGFTGTFTGTFNGTISGTLTGSLNGNASTATALQTARSIGITGSGASGSVQFDGTGNAIIPLTVATQATATNNTTIATTAFVQNVNVAETGAAAYALRLKTPRTFTFSGDATGSLTFDGTSNVSTSLTVRPATTEQTGIVQLNDTLTSDTTNQALTANAGRVLNDKIDSITNIAVYDVTDTHATVGVNPTFTNTYGKSIIIWWQSRYGGGSDPVSDSVLYGPDGTTVVYRQDCSFQMTVPPNYKYQLIHKAGGGWTSIIKVYMMR